jgi:hypothetical protein
MEAIIMFAVLVAVAAFGAIAMLFGQDSRDGRPNWP